MPPRGAAVARAHTCAPARRPRPAAGACSKSPCVPPCGPPVPQIRPAAAPSPPCRGAAAPPTPLRRPSRRGGAMPCTKTCPRAQPPPPPPRAICARPARRRPATRAHVQDHPRPARRLLAGRAATYRPRSLLLLGRLCLPLLLLKPEPPPTSATRCGRTVWLHGASKSACTPRAAYFFLDAFASSSAFFLASALSFLAIMS